MLKKGMKLKRKQKHGLAINQTRNNTTERNSAIQQTGMQRAMKSLCLLQARRGLLGRKNLGVLACKFKQD
jgi:hypothetical protein